MFQTPQLPILRQKTTTKKKPGKTTKKKRTTTTTQTVKTTRRTRKTKPRTTKERPPITIDPEYYTTARTTQPGGIRRKVVEVKPLYGRNHLAMWGRKALYIYLVSILSLMGIFYFYVIRLIYEKQNRLQVRLTSFVHYYITSFTEVKYY